MKTIQTGNEFRIYDDSLKTFNQLPAQNYLVSFNKKSGFSLTLYSKIIIKEKVYGVHYEKVDKVLNTFNRVNRNLGVILSGDKGIGKTLFAKILSQKAIEQNIPLIVVNSYVPGIAEFINSIEQEVIVLFDEFDKVFKSTDEYDPQAEMLSLFDGISQGKKLFIITCNGINTLNDFLINRPGRFHYHFRFSYPEADEIRVYLQDHLDEKYWGEIEKVISFSRKVNINYDCLRAIAFELNSGEAFESAIKDLNIINTTDINRFNLSLLLDNGEIIKRRRFAMDLFDDEEKCIDFCDPTDSEDIGILGFTASDCVYDNATGECIIKGEDLKWSLEKYLATSDDEDDKKIYNRYKNTKPVKLIISRCKERDIHYAV